MKQMPTIFILVLLFTPISVLAQKVDVTQIKIVSTWAGLGDGQHGELNITRKSNGYFQNGKRVEDRLIQALLAALNERPVDSPDLANLGVTQAWLDANAEKGFEEETVRYASTPAPNQRALFISTFRNRSRISRVLPALYGPSRTDDYPQLEVTMIGTERNQITVRSESQYPLMLPWQVIKDGRTTKTYNAHISQAVAKLLPEKFTNSWRVSANEMRQELAEAVLAEIKVDWTLLKTENRAGNFLELLRSRFTIETAEINGNHNVEYGKALVNGNSTETNLHVTLRRKDFPQRFFIGAVLPYNNDQVENVGLFLKEIDRYQNLTFSLRCFSEYIASHPKVNVELRFIGNRSFGARAMQSFAADMKQIGKSALATEVEAVQKDVSLLRVGRMYYQGHWLVLPDGRMILWRYRGYDALLKWKPDDFTHKECSDYQGECVGAVISQDGTIISR